MTVETAKLPFAPTPSKRTQQWIFSATTDLLVFGGSAALSLALLAIGHASGLTRRPLPLWSWFVAIVLVDVAHVWTTLFRVYLDATEVRRRPWLYLGMPALTYAVGVALHFARPAWFWSTLAYLAVFHFVRQQYGWVVIYRRRNRDEARIDRWLDPAAIYTATVFPIVWWHAHLPRSFEWLVQGDFVFRVPRPWAEVLHIVHFAVLGAWGVRQVLLYMTERWINVGKVVIVVGTWACWYVGIVATDSDWSFTVTNVIIHGVPYTTLLWHYARRKFGRRQTTHATPGAGRRDESGGGLRNPTVAEWIVARGLWAYLAFVAVLAYLEEACWDQLVWHERARIFGDAGVRPSASVWLFVVPLLAVPQATHYALDGWIWRMGPRNPTLSRDLGFGGRPAGPESG